MADSCRGSTENTKFCKAIILQLKINKYIYKDAYYLESNSNAYQRDHNKAANVLALAVPGSG